MASPGHLPKQTSDLLHGYSHPCFIAVGWHGPKSDHARKTKGHVKFLKPGFLCDIGQIFLFSLLPVSRVSFCCSVLRAWNGSHTTGPCYKHRNNKSRSQQHICCKLSQTLISEAIPLILADLSCEFNHDNEKPGRKGHDFCHFHTDLLRRVLGREKIDGGWSREAPSLTHHIRTLSHYKANNIFFF